MKGEFRRKFRGHPNGETGGIKTLSISGLNYDTTYTWYINATDGTEWTNKTYSFTTENQIQTTPVILLEDGFEGEPFNDNWDDQSSAWKESTMEHTGESAAYADGTTSGSNDGPFTCNNLNTSDAQSIEIEFYLRHVRTESTDYSIYYYNGTDYIHIQDLGDIGADSTYHHYTDTITDNQYFIPKFRIQLYADLLVNSGDEQGGEYTNLDDVLIIKNIQTPSNNPPEIRDTTLTHSTPKDTNPTYGWENITTTITDTNGIQHTWIHITYPDTTTTNTTMTHTTGDTYTYNTTTLNQHGTYTITITAQDTQGNTNTTTPLTYTKAPNYDINEDGIINIIDLTKLSIDYQKTGPNGWTRSDVNNDGTVNIIDLTQISLHYQQTWN